MKKIQIIILMLITSVYAYSQNNVEVNVVIPIGASFGLNFYTLKGDATNEGTKKAFEEAVKKNSKDTFIGFDTGIYVHVGNRFSMGKSSSFSLLWELGYSHDTISFSKMADKDNYYVTSVAFESLIFGIYPKFNFGKFTFGIAGGIKMPIFATSLDSYFDYQKDILHQNKEFLNVVQIYNTFEIPIIPYAKLSLDYAILSQKDVELTLGGYVGYDFGMTFKNPDFSDFGLRENINQYISSIDVGFQVGVKILNVKQ